MASDREKELEQALKAAQEEAATAKALLEETEAGRLLAEKKAEDQAARLASIHEELAARRAVREGRSTEYMEYWMTAPRFLAQINQDEPEYIHASPEHPVKVKLGKVFKKTKEHPEGEMMWHPEDPTLSLVKPKAPKDPGPVVKGRGAAAKKIFGTPGGGEG